MKLAPHLAFAVVAAICLLSASNSSAAPPESRASTSAGYDLAADIADRKRQAMAELGPRTDVQVIEGTFVVAAPGGRRALAPALDVTRQALSAYFNGRFEKRPARAVSVYLFPRAEPYDAYCKKRDAVSCISPFGFYVHGDRRIVMNIGPGLGTLTHELVHPLVETDFPAAPDWINEGIASLFEHFHFSAPGEIHGGKNWRHPRLVKALRSKQERMDASLPTLFALNDEQFRGHKEDLNYATARYLCLWLDQKQKLWPFYQRWRDHYADDRSGAKSFQAVLGKTPAEADAEWTAWVLGL